MSSCPQRQSALTCFFVPKSLVRYTSWLNRSWKILDQQRISLESFSIEFSCFGWIILIFILLVSALICALLKRVMRKGRKCTNHCHNIFLLQWYVLCRARNNIMAVRGADQSTESIEAGQEQVEYYQQRSLNALDPFIIATLPVYVYKQSDHPSNDDTRDCAVCLCSFENEEKAMLLPNCNHLFHEQCINMWFSSHSTCPICRCRVEPRVVPEAKEKRVGWSPFTAIDLSFFHPIAPLSEGLSDGSAQGSEVEEQLPRLNSFQRLVEAEWRQIRDGSSSWR